MRRVFGGLIREFGSAVDKVRRSVETAVKSIGSTSEQLAEIASAASRQAITASHGCLELLGTRFFSLRFECNGTQLHLRHRA